MPLQKSPALERIEGRRGVLVAEAIGENPLRLQFEGDPAAGFSKADPGPAGYPVEEIAPAVA